MKDSAAHKQVVRQTSATTSQEGHLGYLDGLRAVAALFVVMHHSFLQITEAPFCAKGQLEAFSILLYGRDAVNLFIVLSGFCLMLPVIKHGKLRSGTIDFFKRRIRRILPPYYYAMALSLLLVYGFIGSKTHSHWDASLPVTLRSIWSHALLIQDAVGEDFTINHVFWSVAVEWRIYFLFPLLVTLWCRFGPWITTSISIIGSLFLTLVLHLILDKTLTSYYIGLFVLGMLAAHIVFTDNFARLQRLPWGQISVLFMGLIFLNSNLPVSTLQFYVSDFLGGLWAFSLLIWISKGGNWMYKALNFPLLTWIGTFAYSIYLIHAPLIQLLWQYPFSGFQKSPLSMFVALMLIGTPLIVVASYVFFLVCERPFLHKRVQSRLGKVASL